MRRFVGRGALCVAIAWIPCAADAQTTPVPLRSDIVVSLVRFTNTAPSPSVRIARDPRDDALYILKSNGRVYRVERTGAAMTQVASAADHGQARAQGFAIAPDGTMLVVGNADVGPNETRAQIMKGTPDGAGGRAWSLLAETAPYPKSNTPFDHRFNGIVVDPAGRFVYVASGSRTDHGEVQDALGAFPGAREVGLTAVVLRLPLEGVNLALPNDREALRDAGYVFCEGTRNSFDMAFAPNGDLIAPDNGPSRDNADEVNWLRVRRHFGFPWRMGGTDNPQRHPTYDPAADRLLNPIFDGVANGSWRNDPTFPPPPAGVVLLEPIPNSGPDADRYRAPGDGRIRDASDAGRLIRSVTAHRSPLGVVFDRAGALAPEFRFDGFMLSWTPGDPQGDAVSGPFRDAGQDLIRLNLVKTNGAYSMRAQRLVEAFNRPIDAEIIGKSIFVLEYGGDQGLWEVRLP